MHQTGSIFVDEHLILPSTPMQKGDEAWAISFAVPRGTKGIKYVLESNLLDVRKMLDAEKNISWDHVGPQHFCTTILFDDVLIPWERVFLHGEVGKAVEFPIIMGDCHTITAIGCKAGYLDTAAGVAASLADYNGIPHTVHARQKITKICTIAELAYAACVGSAYLGEQVLSGVWRVNTRSARATLSYAKEVFKEVPDILIDLAGGLMVTQPSELDCENPELRESLESCLRADPNVPDEHRLRMLRVAESLCSGSAQSLILHAMGAPELNLGMLRSLFAQDLEKYKELARGIAGIKVPPPQA